MTPPQRLIKRAEATGIDLTPELDADLRKLATVSNKEIQNAYRRYVSKALARKFKVPVAVMEERLRKGETK